MRRSCSTGWTSWKAGRRKCAPCSATGSAAAKAPRSNFATSEEHGPEKIRVFTTRVDTIFGATSVQLAPEHALVKRLAADDAGLREQVAKLLDEQKKAREAGDMGAIEKHGVPTGQFADQSIQRRTGADLGGELRARRLRHGRHHERAGPRCARLRICEEVCDSDSAGDRAARIRARKNRSCRFSRKTACW